MYVQAPIRRLLCSLWSIHVHSLEVFLCVAMVHICDVIEFSGQWRFVDVDCSYGEGKYRWGVRFIHGFPCIYCFILSFYWRFYIYIYVMKWIKNGCPCIWSIIECRTVPWLRLYTSRRRVYGFQGTVPCGPLSPHCTDSQSLSLLHDISINII